MLETKRERKNKDEDREEEARGETKVGEEKRTNERAKSLMQERRKLDGWMIW